VSSTGQPDPVAWTVLDEGAVVVAADGSEIGRVLEVVGDEEADIFDGLVLDHAQGGGSRYIGSERVRGIWPDRVETDLGVEEAASLPAYEEPKVTTWHADTGESRLKRAWHDLFGRRSS
jgi:hypothetical protein